MYVYLGKERYFIMVQGKSSYFASKVLQLLYGQYLMKHPVFKYSVKMFSIGFVCNYVQFDKYVTKKVVKAGTGKFILKCDKK